MPDVSIVLTNENNKVLNPYSQRYQPPMAWNNIPANTWPGYNRAFDMYSFQIPLATNLLFLTNSTYHTRRPSSCRLRVPSSRFLRRSISPIGGSP